MPKKSASPPSFDKSRRRWKATIPAGLSTTGRRVRTWHPSRDAAREWLATVTSTSTPSATIPAALAMKADEARLILDPLDLDLVEAARIITTAVGIVGDTRAILDACRSYRATLDATKASERFDRAAIAYLDAKAESIRPETIRGYRQHLVNDLRELHGRMVANLTGDMLMGAVENRTPSVQNAVLTTAVAFLGWCARPPRRWCDSEAIAKDVIKPSVRLDDDVSTLEPEAVRALLTTAESVAPGTAIGFAVAIFAGVRMRELVRLKWRNITEELIVIDASQAKRAKRRAIPINPPLRAFLAAYRPAEVDPDAPIVGPNWVNHEKTARRLAGWDLACNPPPPPGTPPPHRGPWPKNVCRHTCASLLVATGTALEALVFQFGHSGGHGTLRRHYVGRLTAGEAAAILAIRPAGETAAAILETVERATA